MYIGICSLCSILCRSSFGSNYSSGLLECYKLGTLTFRQFLPFFFLLSSWRGKVGIHQFSDLSRDIQSGSSLGSGWSSQWHLLSGNHSFVCLFVCVPCVPCWKMSLYRSMSSRALWGRMFWYITAFILPLTLTNLTKNIRTIWCCHHRAKFDVMVLAAWFPPDIKLDIEAKKFKLLTQQNNAFVTSFPRLISSGIAGFSVFLNINMENVILSAPFHSSNSTNRRSEA